MKTLVLVFVVGTWQRWMAERDCGTEREDVNAKT